MTKKKNGPNIILWDIEASNLNANFGITLCIGYKRLGDKKPTVVSVRDDKKRFKKNPTDDTHVLRTIAPVLRDADGWVTWYGKKFDEPFVNSRLLIKGMDPLPPFGNQHIDGWEICKKRLKLHSNRLASASSFLGLEDKTPLEPTTWLRSTSGHVPSLKYIEEHCWQDVEVLEQVYNKLKPLMVSHPNVGAMTYDGPQEKPTCPVCNGTRLTKSGFRYAQVSKTQRYQCKECGAWAKGKPIRLKGIDVRS